MMREPQDRLKPLGLVWVDCPRSVVSAGLVRALEKQATVHQGLKPPEDVPSCIILCANSHESLSERMEFYQECARMRHRLWSSAPNWTCRSPATPCRREPPVSSTPR